MESPQHLITFLVEQYGAVTSDGQATTALRAALHDLQKQGRSVRLVCSVSVPDDESALFVMEAESIALVEQTCARASITPSRISIAIAERGDPPTSTHDQSRSAPTEPERITSC